ncbi:MAG: hypothetical protein IJ705_04070 [Oscillospiraceae bacterium]|nr:hypothetical protein [Oscillospiraceae bacterium]
MSSAWIQARYALGTVRTRNAASIAARAGVPVQPVDPVRPVAPDREVRVPLVLPETELPGPAALNEPSELLARMRIGYPEGEGFDPEAFWNANALAAKSPAEVMEEDKCETCERRRYQDGSDDPGVSFKSPTHLSPEQAASAVMGHEQEHVVREQAEAAREGRKVISQSVSIHTDICPECGKVYVSGGVTRTVTAPENPTEGGMTETENQRYEAA